MNPVAAIARSGMNAAELSLRTAANNVANAMTPGFERQRVVAREAAGGGVQAQVQPAVQSDVQAEVRGAERRAAEAAQNRAQPAEAGAQSEARGEAQSETQVQTARSEPSGVQEEDVVAQLQARNAFLANLQVFRRADEAQRRLIDDRA
jgi:flagellar basal body rod protein FlgC